MKTDKSFKGLRAILFLLMFSLFLVSEVQAKPGDPSGSIKKNATVEGFRSARFGMSENEVVRAINKDFKIFKSDIHQDTHPMDKTKSLWIKVNNILAGSGPSKIYYVFGYKSGRLIQVNVLWGKPVTDKPNPQKVIDAANQLRDYFLRQNYQKEGMLANAALGEGMILVFRGKDAKGRMVVLFLTDPGSKENKNSAHKDISLRLSYVENPESPDIFSIPAGDF